MDALHQTAYAVAGMLIAGMFVAAIASLAIAIIARIVGKIAFKAGQLWKPGTGKDTHDLLDDDDMPF